jgi:hypothetical protein
VQKGPADYVNYAGKVSIMANTQHTDTQNAKIGGLLARYLELRAVEQRLMEKPDHLDEDTLSAFAEGCLNERETLPVLNHLTDCSFCRHKTVELVRLDLHFADADAPVRVREAEGPVSVSSVLSGILSRIFGTSSAEVFAHKEPDKYQDEDKDEKDEE